MPTAVPPTALPVETEPGALSCCLTVISPPSSSELRVSESPNRRLEEGEETQSLNEDSGFLSSSLRVSSSRGLWRGGVRAASLTGASFREQYDGPGCWLLRFLRPDKPLSQSLRPPASRVGRCLVSAHSGEGKSLPALPITSISAGKLLAVSIGSGLARGPFRGSCLRRASDGISLFIATNPHRSAPKAQYAES